MDIRIESLTKSYGYQKAVDAISFEVKPGEILGFLGPNGAGKTTTMKIITDYLEMDSGDVFIGGKSIRQHDMRKYIGYLPENNPLYEDMPVIDYLIFCAELQGVPRALIQDRLRTMIRLCGLDIEKHKKIGELSKGYRQRVGLAQAMIHDPAVLILDEPTTGLDPNQIVEIRELIRRLGREKTVILSTHILPEVEATCDRILIINRGSIVADGSAETLRKQASGRKLVNIRIKEGDLTEIHNALKSLPGVGTVDITETAGLAFELSGQGESPLTEEVFKLCVRKKWILLELTPVETKLEDIFRNLTMK